MVRSSENAPHPTDMEGIMMNQDWNERFLNDFEAMSTNGATPGGGVERQAASDGDIKSRQWFEELLKELGATVVYDEIGNQFGIFEFDPALPFVGLGSHLDSQPLAGGPDPCLVDI